MESLTLFLGFPTIRQKFFIEKLCLVELNPLLTLLHEHNDKCWGRDMHGDFGTSRAVVTSLGSSWGGWGSSMNLTMVLATDMVSLLDSLGCLLTGGKVAWCLLLYISSNLKYPSVVSRLPQGVL